MKPSYPLSDHPAHNQPMMHYQSVYKFLQNSPLQHWLVTIPNLVRQKFDPAGNGNLERWFPILEQLPKLRPSQIALDQDTITIGRPEDLQQDLEPLLRGLQPWRKGPYELFGIHIDTEWRSDWKWRRLASHLSPLENRLVLDVGCGNGYHCLRMLGSGARRVIGIDPGMLSIMQFYTLKHFLGPVPVDILPLRLEQIPSDSRFFDTVFSMGVLYHRRSPIDHLYELSECLKPGGELILETLVIEGKEGEILFPTDRYAQMRNVWFIPSCPTLETWMKRCGYENIRLVDVTQTSIEEQRSTDWMQFHSLPQFLDPEDHDKTCEGYPAPRRAIFIATRP